MARGVNKVILVGNVGGEPEVRYLPSGGAVTSLSIATTEAWKDKQTGDKQERTEWHKVVCFNRLAEIAGEYFHKGSKLYVEGSLRTRKWQDQQGQDRYTTEIVASDIQILDSKSQSGGTSTAQNNHEEVSASPAPTRVNNTPNTAPVANNKASAAKMIPNNAFDELDDDIPF